VSPEGPASATRIPFPLFNCSVSCSSYRSLSRFADTPVCRKRCSPRECSPLLPLARLPFCVSNMFFVGYRNLLFSYIFFCCVIIFFHGSFIDALLYLDVFTAAHDFLLCVFLGFLQRRARFLPVPTSRFSSMTEFSSTCFFFSGQFPGAVSDR